MPEITTKEILKRYGEIAAKTPDRRQGVARPEATDMAPLRQQDSNNSNSRAGAPVPTRIDTDPNQAFAWQKESSVRHVQQNGSQAYPTNAHKTPPQPTSEFANRNSPYHQRAGSSESARSQGTPNRHSHRPSNWNKYSPNGHIGTAGAV